MKLALYKGTGTFYDKLIRIVTRSKYSHCELVISNICYQSQPRDGGLRLKIINLDPEKWDVFELPNHDYVVALNWFIGQGVKKYDWPGAITSILPFHINLKNRYFCSEACAYMLGIEKPKSQTPESLFRLLSK